MKRTLMSTVILVGLLALAVGQADPSAPLMSPHLSMGGTVCARGESQLVGGTVVVTLPSWFANSLKADGTTTIQLTCKGACSPLCASPVTNSSFIASTTAAGVQTQAFWWEVKATLKE